MQKAQNLLYNWLLEIGEVSYNRINQICNYLNSKLDLNLEKPINAIFYPLFRSGVIEFSGKGKYHITHECIIYKDKETSIIINPWNRDNLQNTNITGFYTLKGNHDINSEAYHFNLLSILKYMPSFIQCISSFPPKHTYSKEMDKNIGLYSTTENGFKKWYFIDVATNKQYHIPHLSENPDALNIARCYDRAIKRKVMGEFDATSKHLRISTKIPILIYRLLMIESILTNSNIDKGYFQLKNIDKKLYLELNRIFCNSIKSI